MHRFRAQVLPLLALVCLVARAQHLPSAVISDPPPDRLHPPFMATMVIPSHGTQLNALMYVASGAGPHPAVILLSGFPGNERNLDLAQAVRRAGWNVLYFNYRGSWGSPGVFSFTHCLEDTEAAIQFLRDPGTAAVLRTDPGRIVLIGHSMGGFVAAFTGAHDPGIIAVGLISAANFGGMAAAQGSQAVAIPRLRAHFSRYGLEPLSGCTPETLARETIAHREQWNFNSYVGQLATRPVLLVTSDDGLASHGRAFAAALRRHGDKQITEHHFATDHSYSADRIGLEAAVLNWLATLPAAQ